MKKGKKNYFLPLFIIMFVFFFLSCSTKKNTSLTRSYHAVTTHYNINFNGKQSYKEGLKSIAAAQKDDYSSIIPMFPISNHANATAAIGKMNTTIEKGRKAIKIHSIKAKPKKKGEKSNSPAFKAFYNQNEFNPALKQAWLLIGKAEFHKAEFLGAIGTFSYITKLYANDKEMLTQAQLWMTNAYAEMDWIYEAEQMLGKVDQNALKSADEGLFAATNAVLLLKKEDYKAAIPFVELALAKEKDKGLKLRFSYLLAQLHLYCGNKKEAEKAFTSVIKKSPPYEMAFNARINLAQLKSENNKEKALKELRKMAKQSKNKNYLDQIYHHIAKVYLQAGDTTQAINNYETAAKESTRHGIEKANLLIELADIYNIRKEYVKAQVPYDEASKIIKSDHHDYKRIQKQAEVLAELAAQQEIIFLQDSLQHLATLSEKEQLDIVNKIIADLIEKEKEDAENESLNSQNLYDDDDDESPLRGMVPDRMSAGKWYFYNSETINSGKIAFKKRWGQRKLEDNWRRANKASVLFEDTPSELAAAGKDSETAEDQDSENSEAAQIDDLKNPLFYLQQIPKTAEQIELSNNQIADALLNSGMIFKDRIADFPMATSSYEEFIKRFKSEKRIPEVYFQLFLIETQRDDRKKAEIYRNKLITSYPKSKEAKMLENPDYIGNFTSIQKEENSLYKATYQAYSKNKFKQVTENYNFAKSKFPLSRLLPKFMFLNALSVGKTGSPEKLEASLNELIETYPESDVSAMAKDIIALMQQGREVQAGTTHGSLLAKREEQSQNIKEDEEPTTKTFSTNKNGKHRLLLLSTKEQTEMYRLMYELAAFNFTSFMIKEFDLQLSKLNEKENILSLTNFESYDEVNWYLNTMMKDSTLAQLLQDFEVQKIILSDENFELVRRNGIPPYLAFQREHKMNSTQEGTTKRAERETFPTKEIAQKPAVPKQEEKPKEASSIQSKEITPNETDSLTKQEKEAETTTLAETTKEKEEKKTAPKSLETIKKEQEAEQPTSPEKKPQAEEKLDLYKGLFAHQPNKPHFVAIYLLSGKINFDTFKTKIDAYNAQNYALLPLEVSLEPVGAREMIIIGEFENAELAKSYLMRIIKEEDLYDEINKTNHRNLLGTQRNLNVMIKNNALSTYSSFMKEFYLK